MNEEKESIILRASKIAAQRVANAIDMAETQLLDSYRQQTDKDKMVSGFKRFIGKKYDKLTSREIIQYFQLYPDLMALWTATEELKKLRQPKEE